MSVWIAGACIYEILGISEFLTHSSFSVKRVRSCDCFRSGDVLILCFSQSPLLGWWRYLKLIYWLNRRYDIRLLVLCPDVVYRSNIIKGRNLALINGEKSICLIIEDIRKFLKKDALRRTRNKMLADFWDMASYCLQPIVSKEMNLYQLRKEYQCRKTLLRDMGFDSLHNLKIFMAGFNLESIPSGKTGLTVWSKWNDELLLETSYW